jgi:hypothetical protein
MGVGGAETREQRRERGGKGLGDHADTGGAKMPRDRFLNDQMRRFGQPVAKLVRSTLGNTVHQRILSPARARASAGMQRPYCEGCRNMPCRGRRGINVR